MLFTYLLVLVNGKCVCWLGEGLRGLSSGLPEEKRSKYISVKNGLNICHLEYRINTPTPKGFQDFVQCTNTQTQPSSLFLDPAYLILPTPRLFAETGSRPHLLISISLTQSHQHMYYCPGSVFVHLHTTAFSSYSIKQKIIPSLRDTFNSISNTANRHQIRPSLSSTILEVKKRTAFRRPTR